MILHHYGTQEVNRGANVVTVRIDSRDDFTPTPVVSRSILTHNRSADGT